MNKYPISTGERSSGAQLDSQHLPCTASGHHTTMCSLDLFSCLA